MISMSSITFFGLTFHWYGFILGTAVVVATELMLRQGRRQHIVAEQLWRYWWPMLGGALVGARAWHVVTDYQLYVSQPWQALALWHGGLSILGAVAGGAAAGWWRQRTLPPHQRIPLPLLADLAAFGLPVGQAIGRLGNWVNQELYGWPSLLPWAIQIDIGHRLPGFEQYSTFHPLFLYELVLTAGFAAVIWGWSLLKRPHLGTGRVFCWYIAYYSVVRFGLDFLRPDKSRMGWLGTNQWILLAVILVFLIWWLRKIVVGQNWLKTSSIVIALAATALVAMGCRPVAPSPLQQLLELPDRSIIQLHHGERTLSIEVVNTPASISQGLSGRSEIGADGMLFVFPSPRVPSFWMKQMHFDLDLVWLLDLQVTEVTARVPAPPVGATENKLPIFQPQQKVNMVLEVPAGRAAELGLESGVKLGFVPEKML